MADNMRVTTKAAYVEGRGGDSMRVTTLGAYVELRGGDSIRVTAEPVYLELKPGDGIHTTSIAALVELSPPYVAPVVAAHNARVTFQGAYIERRANTGYAETRVTNLIILAGAELTGILMPRFILMAEVLDQQIRISKFGLLSEIQSKWIRVTKFGALVEIEYRPPEAEVSVPTYFPESAGTRHMHDRLPDEITGYSFDPDYSWWSTVVPEESTNLIINPSFELWNSLGNIIEYDWGGIFAENEFVEFPAVGATAGRRCAMFSSAGGSVWLEYEGGLLVTPGSYTFSFDLYATRAPLHFNIAVVDTGNTTIGSRRLTVTKTGWHRYHLTYVELGSGTRKARVTLLNTNPAETLVYTDAWQFERKAYPTTYLDGDMVSTTDVRAFQSYFWHGTPHASPSTRREFANNGGRIISWHDYVGFQTTNLIGLAMSPVELRTQLMASGKEIHKGVNSLPRDFSITGRIYGEDYRQLIQKHNALVDLLRPNKAIRSPQTILRYQRTDANGHRVGAPMDIICSYRDGLQGTINGLYQETIPLQFHASDPAWMDVIENSAEIQLRKAIWANGLIYRDERGDFQNLGIGETDAAATLVGFMADGSPVVVGGFNTFAGDAVEEVARWDGFQWVQLGTFDAGSTLAIDTGYDTGFNLVIANSTEVLEYQPLSDSWIQLGGHGFDNLIYSLKRDVNGDIWIGGLFDYAEDTVTRFRHVAKWDYEDEEWQPLAGGVGDPYDVFPMSGTTVTAILPMNDGNVYIAGLFGDAFDSFDPFPGEVLAKGIARWNANTGTWHRVGNGLYGETKSLLLGKDGYLYAVGSFETDAGLNPLTMRGFARFTGYQWEEVFHLKRVNENVGADGARIDENGVIWFFGQADSPDEYFDVSTTLGPVEFFGYKDGVYYPPMAWRTFGAYDMAIGPGNRMLLSTLRFTGDEDGLGEEVTQTMYVPYLNEINYTGNADAPLVVHLEGPLRPSFVENLTLNGGVHFKPNLELGENEHMIVRTDCQRSLAYSNARPNLHKFIMPGLSSISAISLLPGNNRISVYSLDPLDSSAKGWLTWKNRFWGNDGIY